MKGTPGRAGVLTIGLTLALAGCLLLPRSKQEPRGPLSIPFNHKAHIDEAGLSCTDCHAGATKELKAGYPAKEECAGCHESGVKDGGPQPFEVEINGLSDPIAWPTRNVLPEHVAFSHARHAAAGVDCKNCHGDVGAGTAVVTEEVKVERSRCAACHEGRDGKDATWPHQLASDCQSCHVEGWGKTIAPPTHETDWIKRHGNLARAGFFPEHGEDCASCHGQETCASCHKAMAPASHNNNWKERAHGSFASADRESCAVCHTQDSCQRCHSETRPRSHTAGWAPPSGQRHCASCHLQGADECRVCHGSAIVHASAPRQPAFHVPGMPCLRCHDGIKAKQPHPVADGNCLICHPK